MLVNKIAKVTIFVNNQEEAKKFWTEKAEFVVAFEQPAGPEMTWLEVAPSKESETTFVLYDRKVFESQTGKPTYNPNIIMSTNDIEKAYNTMKQNGVQVEELISMPYGKMFNFKDQDGNQYLLREDK